MAGLSFLRYLGGCLLILVALGALVRAAVHLRSVLVGWQGAPARLVEVTIGGSIVTAGALALGSLRILAGWPAAAARFVRVLPGDYQRVLEAQARMLATGMSPDEAAMAAFEENATRLARVGGA